MILEFNIKTAHTKGRPRHTKLEVSSVEEALNFIKATLRRKRKSEPQMVVSDITITSKALSK